MATKTTTRNIPVVGTTTRTFWVVVYDDRGSLFANETDDGIATRRVRLARTRALVLNGDEGLDIDAFTFNSLFGTRININSIDSGVPFKVQLVVV